MGKPTSARVAHNVEHERIQTTAWIRVIGMKDMNTPKVATVQPLEGKRLLVTFVGGEKKVYGCNRLLDSKPFQLLKTEAFFRAVQVDRGGYGISWNDDIDLSEYELWHNGIVVEHESMLQSVVPTNGR
jgi:hypothetical protein